MSILGELEQRYRAECDENLEILELSLIGLDGGGARVDQDLVKRALYAVHALKAEASLFDLDNVGELAHQMEHALALFRWGRMVPTSDRITVLLSAADQLRDLFENPDRCESSEISRTLFALAGLCTGGKLPAIPDGEPERRLRMLVVEDEPTSRFFLETFLSRYGDCDTAVNGREAVERFKEILNQGQQYDLICMDIMMPEMDGAETLRLLRGMEDSQGILHTEGAKIIMTTAVDDLKQVARSFWDLCDAYLVKPIDLAKLVSHMKAYHLIR